MLQAAEALNRPLRVVAGGRAEQAQAPLVTVDHPGVDVDAVKRADDGSGDLVVRLHEAVGDRATVTLDLGRADHGRGAGLDPGGVGEPLPLDGRRVTLALRPFELATVRLRSSG